mmetsp:Transcript_15562/g.60856  ORF Transcript_15562/g.60856 Transcript_15562/m.60856 type:complete len:139 (-) Transcript_15562:1410-1826(-)
MSCCGEEELPAREGRALLQDNGAGGGYQTAPAMEYSVGGNSAPDRASAEAPERKKRVREADLPPDTTLQCKRCRKIYKVQDNGPEMCRYHSGRFVKGSTAPMSSTKWTCCKSYNRKEVGCKVNKHRAAQDSMFFPTTV